MMKTGIAAFLLVCIILQSCIVQGPKYTRVEKVFLIKPGMTMPEVTASLGVEPYDIKWVDSTGERTLIYKYRVTDRKTMPYNFKETNGKEVRGKYMDLYTFFTSSDTLYRLESHATDATITEKKLNVNSIINFFTVTLPPVLIVLGLTQINK